MRVPTFLLVLLAVGGSGAAAGACAGAPAPVQRAPGPYEHTAVSLSGSGDFTTDDTEAIAYKRKLVPEGAQASFTVESTSGQTRSSLVVEGFLSNRTYGAHVHTKPCGKSPDDSGPHYQHHPGQIDPTSEIWLDFTTDGEGNGRASARHDWALDPDRLPASLVIHSKVTVPKGPQAGMAGNRIACLTLR
jgi:Cu-Zn family superoxide dismutase